MHSSVSDEIKIRERINERLTAFCQHDTWTPAMGAMLISGVLPVQGCTEIPSSAASLRDPSMPATVDSLEEAHKVLKSWTESFEEDEDPQPPPTVTPHDFLMWCSDSYGQWPDVFKPKWLRYVLGWAGWEQIGDVPAPAPSQLVAHAAERDVFASVVLSTTIDAAGTPEADKPYANSDEPSWIGHIGRDGEEVAERIRAAVRQVCRTHPEFATSPDNRSLINEAWTLFRAWAAEVENEPKGATSTSARRKHFPLQGLSGRSVFFDPSLETSEMNKDAFRKRISPKARGA